jgi:hypothetical protein
VWPQRPNVEGSRVAAVVGESGWAQAEVVVELGVAAFVGVLVPVPHQLHPDAFKEVFEGASK